MARNSAASLESIIEPCEADTFLARHWGEDFAFFKGGSAKHRELFSWRKLNRLLTQHRLSYPRVRVMKNRESVRAETYTLRRQNVRNQSFVEYLDVAMINFHLSEGASLIVNAVDEMDSELNQLCGGLGRVFGDYISANAYASFGTEAGFPIHWDDHEAIILQIDGRKRWRIFEPTRLHPLSEDVEGNLTKPDRLLLDVVLEPGDTLYIPRGFWHDVTPVGESTLHLTLGAIPPTGLSWLRHVVERAADNVSVRKNIPRFRGDEERASFKQEVLQVLQNVCAAADLDEYLSSRAARLTPRSTFSLPQSVDLQKIDGATVVQFAGLTYTLRREEADGAIVIGAFDRDWRFSSSAAPFFEAVFSAPRISVHELIDAAPTLRESEITELVRYLLGEGFLSIAD